MKQKNKTLHKFEVWREWVTECKKDEKDQYVQKHTLQKYKQVNSDSFDLVAKWF